MVAARRTTVAALAALTLALAGCVERVSVGSDEQAPNGDSWAPAISASGRFVAFSTAGDNLDTEDTGDADVFVRDRVTGQTQPASRSVGPGFSSYGSDDAAISADGRYVAFTSDRAGLVQGDTNQTTDVFRFDRQTKITTRVSVSSAEEQSNFGSGGIGAGPSVSISGDGRYVAFISRAWNLVPDDTNQGFPDIFIRDTVAGTTSRIPAESVGNAAPPNLTFHGLSTPELSQDGRFLAFTSLLGQPTGSGGAVMVDATDVYLTRLATGATTRVSGPAGLGQARRGISISADGGVVAFSSGASDLVSGDTNGVHDVFLRNTSSGAFTRIAAGSVSGAGPAGLAFPSLDWSGGVVTFVTTQDRAIWVRHVAEGVTKRVVDAGFTDEGAYYTGAGPRLSADGKLVAFSSTRDDLVQGDSGLQDVFVANIPPPGDD